MGVNSMAIGFGGVLLLVGILGGGFQLRELIIPTVSRPVRFTSLIAGLILILAGFRFDPHRGSDPLPRPNAVPEVIAAIRYADDIEAQALHDLDPSLLAKAYTGEALRGQLEHIQWLRSEGVYAVATLKNQDISVVNISTDGASAEARLVETWDIVYFRSSNQECAWRTPSHRVPQTLHLRREHGGWMIGTVLFDLDAPKAESVECE